MSFSSNTQKNKTVEKTNDLIKQGLSDLEQVEQKSDNISKNLYDQNSKIDNAINNVDKTQQSANNSLYTARGLKSFFGQIINYFTKPKQVQEDKDLNDIRAQQQANNNIQDQGNGHQQINQDQKTGNQAIDEQNELLRQMNEKVERLKSKQKNINTELTFQNKKLEKFHEKEDKLQNSLLKLDKDLKKI